MSTSRRPLALRLAVAAILMGLLTACVSREDSSGAKQAPATVPLSDLAGLTLQVGDQKGGTESLLRAAGALDGLPYKIAFSTFTSGPPQIEAATAGKIDFAITGNTPPIFGAASNSEGEGGLRLRRKRPRRQNPGSHRLVDSWCGRSAR